MTTPPFEDERRLTELLRKRDSIHDCSKTDCQIYPDGTRRRNPYANEINAAEQIPLLQEKNQLAKDGEHSRPKPSEELKKLYKKVTGRELVE